jgi:hypothetical protein
MASELKRANRIHRGWDRLLLVELHFCQLGLNTEFYAAAEGFLIISILAAYFAKYIKAWKYNFHFGT